MYSIEWVPAARRDVERLARRAPPRDVRRVMSAIASLGTQPRPPGATKMAGREGAYRLRVGRYRVIYSVDEPARTVVVVKVAPRAEAYR